MQGEEQVRAQLVRRRIFQCDAVPRGGLRMPAMPVAQMHGTRQASLARMALLAVELARKADARLVLSRGKGSAFQQRVEDGARKVG